MKLTTSYISDDGNLITRTYKDNILVEKTYKSERLTFHLGEYGPYSISHHSGRISTYIDESLIYEEDFRNCTIIFNSNGRISRKILSDGKDITYIWED